MNGYFAYGSNMNPERMRAREIAFSECGSAHLSDFELRFNKRAHNKTGIGYANVSWCAGNNVEGVYYELASGSELNKLDVHEGTPFRYSREQFPVLVDGEIRWAWIYVANPAWVTEGLQVEENYLSHLLSGEAFLSQAYLKKLQSVPVVPSNRPADLRVNV